MRRRILRRVPRHGPAHEAAVSGGLFVGSLRDFYQAAETGYNFSQSINASGVNLSSLYGQPNLWQIARRIRLGATFTF